MSSTVEGILETKRFVPRWAHRLPSSVAGMADGVGVPDSVWGVGKQGVEYLIPIRKIEQLENF